MMPLHYPARVSTIADTKTRTQVVDFMAGYAERLLRYHVQERGMNLLLPAPPAGSDWLDVYGDWFTRETVALFTRDTIVFLTGNSLICELYMSCMDETWVNIGARFAGARNRGAGFTDGISGQAAVLNLAAVRMGPAGLDLKRNLFPKNPIPSRLFHL